MPVAPEFPRSTQVAYTLDWECEPRSWSHRSGSLLTESQSIVSSQGSAGVSGPILEVQRDFSGNGPHVSAVWAQAEGFADHLHHGGP